MLNPFPDLLAFSLLAPFLIRISLGILFVSFGYSLLVKNKSHTINIKTNFASFSVYTISILEILGGFMLIVGFFTQIASIILSIFAISMIVIKVKHKNYFKYSLIFYILIFIITFTLMFSGAGIFAIDLPL